MNQSNNINPKEQGYVLYGIDKITLGIDYRNLTTSKTPDQLKGIMDITQWGSWLELNIQNEINGVSQINSQFPLISVLHALNYANNIGLFNQPLASQLYQLFHGINIGIYLPNAFIFQFIDTGIFKLDEYELFFDFYDYSPFFGFDESIYYIRHNTVYTPDYRKYKDKYGNTTSVKRSMMAYYDRGLKLGSNQNIKRLEFRICDKRAKLILTPWDLVNSVDNFIYVHGNQISHILKRYIPYISIAYDEDYIFQNASNLTNLLWILNKRRRDEIYSGRGRK